MRQLLSDQKIIFLNILLLASIQFSFAQNSIIDRTFGDNGYQLVNFTGTASKDVINDVETLGTGKIVFLGYDDLTNGIIGRLNINGKPDITWNQTGINAYTLPVYITPGYARHIIVKRKNTISNLSDTSVHVILSDGTTPNQFTVFKFNDKGQLDASFGINGKKTVPVTKPIFTIPKALYLPDGKILILIGSSNTPNNDAADFVVVKLKSDGNRDSTFGTNGIVTIDQNLSFGGSTGTRDLASDMTYTTDGKILLTGEASYSASITAVLFRLNSNGSIDNGFTKDLFSTPGTDIRIANVLEQDAGKYILISNNYNYNTGARTGGISRYNYNGSSDYPAFKFTPLPNPFGAYKIQKAELQSDKKVLLLCTGGTNTWKLYKVRIKADGTVDSTFGSNGIYIFDTLSIVPSTGPPGYDQSYSFLKRDRDGNIIIATVGEKSQRQDGLFIKTLGSSQGIQPPPTPIILNVNNKCFNTVTTKGKLGNPPPNTAITITQDGNALNYSAADSSFQYFTTGVTTAGNHTVNVKYNNSAGTTQKDTVYTVASGIVIPTVTISIPSATICPGNQVTFIAVITNAGNSPIYQWQVNGINTGSNNNALTISTLANNDQVKVILTSNAPCAAPATASSNIITMTVNSSAKATGTASSPKQVCKGSSYNVTFTPGNTPLTSVIQIWESINGGAYAAGSSQTFNGSALNFTISNPGIATGKYFFKISTPANSCAVSNNSDTSTTNIDDLVIPIITLANGVLTVSNPDLTAVYTWQLQQAGVWNDIIPAVTGITYKPTIGGDYRAKGAKNACTVNSNSLTVSMPSNQGGGAYLYPNPVKDVLTIDSLKLTEEWETLKITTMRGTEIYSYDIRNVSKISIPVMNLNPGIYLAVLYRKDGSTFVLRFIKQQ